MVRRVTVRRAGGSVSLTIPKDMAQRQHMIVGEEAFVVETDHGILVTAYDPAFARTMEVYQRGARKYRHALRELGS